MAHPSAAAESGNPPVNAPRTPPFTWLYDEGCPCFHEEDLDALLSLADLQGDCEYSVLREYDKRNKVTRTSWSLSANLRGPDGYISASRFYGVVDFTSKRSGNYCSMSVSAEQNVPCPDPGDLVDGYCGYANDNRDTWAYLDDFLISDCKDLFEAVKEEMTTRGCTISIP
jgi:hypothetical protein